MTGTGAQGLKETCPRQSVSNDTIQSTTIRGEKWNACKLFIIFDETAAPLKMHQSPLTGHRETVSKRSNRVSGCI